MTPPPVGSYLRTHRRKSGLSQRELADVLDIITERQISLHENSREIPIFLTAIGYEIVFGVPLAQLFPGVYETLRHKIEMRLTEMEERLTQSTAKGRAAAFIAHKLEWLCERRSLPDAHLQHGS